MSWMGPHTTEEGNTYWYFDLPNKWYAFIIDDTPTHRPYAGQRAYSSACASQHAELSAGTWLTFEEAKHAALSLALQQVHADVCQPL